MTDIAPIRCFETTSPATCKRIFTISKGLVNITWEPPALKSKNITFHIIIYLEITIKFMCFKILHTNSFSTMVITLFRFRNSLLSLRRTWHKKIYWWVKLLELLSGRPSLYYSHIQVTCTQDLESFNNSL